MAWSQLVYSQCFLQCSFLFSLFSFLSYSFHRRMNLASGNIIQMRGIALNRATCSGSLSSLPRVKTFTTPSSDNLTFNSTQLSFPKLVSLYVGHNNNSSLGFQGNKKNDVLVVLRASPDDIHVKRESSNFKRLYKEGKVEEALEAMGEMERNGVLVDPVDLVKLLQVCENKKLVAAAKMVQDYVTRTALEPSIVVFNKLVKMYFKRGDTTGAVRVFEQMPVRDLESWNKMVVGLAKNGEGEEALGIFFRMKKDGVKPDGSTFLGVILACGCLGSVKEGQEHFLSMSRDYGITPSMEHYVAVVDLLGRAGKIAEAKEFIGKMPIEPSSAARETLQKYSATENRKRQDKAKQLRNKGKLKDKQSSNKDWGKKERERMARRRGSIPRRLPKGIIHVLATFNNTIVTVTDIRGQVISWSSGGVNNIKYNRIGGPRRGTPFNAEVAARRAIQKAMKQGMQRAEVMVKGPGVGRDAALRAIRQSGIVLSFIRDVTPMPHNGCRPPKKRKV